MARLQCTSIRADGGLCRSPAQPSGRCFAHDPETAEAAAEARRKGGRNRRRTEATVAGYYGVEGLETPGQRLRVLEIALFDTLSLKNSIGRNRTLESIVLAAEKIQAGVALETRLAALEAIRPTAPANAPDPLKENPDDEDRRPPAPARGIPFGTRRRSGLAHRGAAPSVPQRLHPLDA